MSSPRKRMTNHLLTGRVQGHVADFSSRRHATAVYAVLCVRCPSISLSVSLSVSTPQAGIVSKGLSTILFHYLKGDKPPWQISHS